MLLHVADSCYWWVICWNNCNGELYCGTDAKILTADTFYYGRSTAINIVLLHVCGRTTEYRIGVLYLDCLLVCDISYYYYSAQLQSNILGLKSHEVTGIVCLIYTWIGNDSMENWQKWKWLFWIVNLTYFTRFWTVHIQPLFTQETNLWSI